MFNLGKDDKKDLQENMEEIKDLVSGEGQTSQEDTGRADNSGQQSFLNQEEAQEADNFTEPQNTGGQQPAQNMQQPQQIQENVQNQEETAQQGSEQQGQGLDESLRQLKEEIEHQMDEKEKEIEAVENTGSTESYEGTDVDESQATKKLSKMSAEGSSLFLEVDKFEKVENLVREMRNLSREMGSVMDELEQRSQESGTTEEEAQSILNEFENRRDQLEETVSN
ncbi:MAG: hypothetical protein ABEJ93_02840 [Candidatus Nanohalobium sp.]